MVRIALGQINTTVGDLEGNVDTMSAWAGRATDAGADLICFPELAITGYPPEDLVLRRTFVDDNLEALEELARQAAGGCAVLTGFVDRSDAGIHNAAALLDGGSMVVSPQGELAHRAAMFEEDLLVVDLQHLEDGQWSAVAEGETRRWPDGPEEVYRALVIGTGDYVRKNGFSEVLVGLSGGIDSALTATIASDGLGPEAVRAMTMPSPYSSAEGVED